ncbi:MAG: hypothetical protein JJU12_01315 [Chlamydiales bacterium]|nr:hypothetical protein [Chlamydiales bacterium]
MTKNVDSLELKNNITTKYPARADKLSRFMYGCEWEEETRRDRLLPQTAASTKEKIKRGLKRGGLFLGGIVGGPLNLSEEFRKATFEVALKGYKEKKIFRGGTNPLDAERKVVKAHQPNLIKELSERNEYDLKNSGDIQQLLREPHIKGGLISDGKGNSYLPLDDKSFIFVSKGDASRATLVSRPLTKLIIRLGYDPKDRETIKAYIDRPDIRKQLLSDGHGNYYLPEHRRNGTSSFLFISKGNFNNPSSIVISDTNTGEALKGSQFEKAMFAYGYQYEDMINGIEKKANEIAQRIAKDKGWDPTKDKDKIDKEKEEIKKYWRTVVISPKMGQSRLYSSVNPNARGIFGGHAFSNPYTGTHLKWESQTEKAITELYQKKADDRLTKDRPFENDNSQGSQPPLQPKRPLDLEDQEETLERKNQDPEIVHPGKIEVVS